MPTDTIQTKEGMVTTALPPSLLLSSRSARLFSSNAIPYASIRNSPPMLRSLPPSSCILVSFILFLSHAPRCSSLPASPSPASSPRSRARAPRFLLRDSPLSIFPYRLIRKKRHPFRPSRTVLLYLSFSFHSILSLCAEPTRSSPPSLPFSLPSPATRSADLGAVSLLSIRSLRLLLACSSPFNARYIGAPSSVTYLRD